MNKIKITFFSLLTSQIPLIYLFIYLFVFLIPIKAFFFFSEFFKPFVHVCASAGSRELHLDCVVSTVWEIKKKKSKMFLTLKRTLSGPAGRLARQTGRAGDDGAVLVWFSTVCLLFVFLGGGGEGGGLTTSNQEDVTAVLPVVRTCCCSLTELSRFWLTGVYKMTQNKTKTKTPGF